MADVEVSEISVRLSIKDAGTLLIILKDYVNNVPDNCCSSIEERIMFADDLKDSISDLIE